MATQDVNIDADGVSLSGLFAPAVGSPRALVLALHGGGMRAGYFHGQAHPDLSLLELGAQLGFSVLALDRPGYGSSSEIDYDRTTLGNQAELAFAALDACNLDHGAGVFIVGHSYGMKVGLMMASLPRGEELLGIDASGAGLRYNPDTLALRRNDGGPKPPGLERSLFWGPEWLYPDGTFSPGIRPVSEVAEVEKVESQLWPRMFPEIAARITIPVRLSLADHERWWVIGDEMMIELKALFRRSARIEVGVQPWAGHNISLGITARAYHLKALAFAEECIVSRVAFGTAR